MSLVPQASSLLECALKRAERGVLLYNLHCTRVRAKITFPLTLI